MAYRDLHQEIRVFTGTVLGGVLINVKHGIEPTTHSALPESKGAGMNDSAAQLQRLVDTGELQSRARANVKPTVEGVGIFTYFWDLGVGVDTTEGR